MSSRLTTPVSKLTRCFSTTPSIARPTQLLNNAPKASAGGSKKRQVKAAAIASEDAGDPQHRHHSTSTTTSTPPHRPVPLPAGARRPIPFMQTFHHSAPKPAAPPLPTVDRAVLPNLADVEGASSSLYDPYAHIRVPLLPDNASPPAGLRQPEAADAPLPRPEILVVSPPGPAQVAPAPLTEAEGMGIGVDGVELKFAHLLGREEGEEGGYELGGGMIRDLWKGLMDDVFGGGGGAAGSSTGGGAAGKGGPAAAA
ncbi:hypothetical protein VTK56DRAFT_1035 [Thermocarpiscus australiensis]